MNISPPTQVDETQNNESRNGGQPRKTSRKQEKRTGRPMQKFTIEPEHF
jgi:hypothetical protein